jgi:hypothetical protein
MRVPSSSATLSPVTVTLPPGSPLALPDASSVPCAMTLELPCFLPLSLVMFPLTAFLPSAEMKSRHSSDVRFEGAACQYQTIHDVPAAAVSAIFPPLASMVLVLATSCDLTSSLTELSIRLSLYIVYWSLTLAHYGR